MRVAPTAIVAAAALAGVAAGLGLYTFVYAKGYSYVTNDPAACANCHVMNDQYDGWLKASHRSVAACNDCHVPPDPIGRYKTKAENGFWHSYYFTTQSFEEPIRATAKSRAIAEARKAQRRGQFFVDFVESENSNGFHAPQEATRILGDAIDLFRRGQVSLRPLKWATK